MASPSKSARQVDVASMSQPSLQQTLKLTTIDLVGGILCHICHVTFRNKKEYDSHYTKHDTGSSDIIYTCPICRKQISSYTSFRGHCYLIHVTKDKFKCETCSKMFSKSSNLKLHNDTKHSSNNPSSKKPFSTPKELQMNQIIHKDEERPPYECQTCGNQVVNIDSCEQHIEDHCQLIYSCPICNESIPNLQGASEHLTKHFGKVLNEDTDTEHLEHDLPKDSSIDIIGGIRCCYCKNIYKNRVELDSHFSMEHSDKDIVYSCIICGKQYNKYFLFGSHCYDHFSKDRFECDECDKTFPRLSLLVIHTEAYHANAAVAADKPFTCGHCEHRFMTEWRLREHLRLAHDARYVQCPVDRCRAIFETPKDLIRHKREHKTSNENHCMQCGLHFTSLGACERHILVHCKKLYSCPVCSRTYGEKYLMMKHVPQHFSSILHICKVCGKTYNAKNRLMEHIKTHSEARGHKCSYCDKSFLKLCHLQDHLNIHTGMKPYKCANCPKTFANYPNWSKHMRRMHNNKSKTLVKPVVENNNEVYKATPNVQKTNENMIADSCKIDGLVEAMGSETSGDTFSYKLYESDESIIESDGIDLAEMEKESRIYDSTNELGLSGDFTERTNMMPENIDAFVNGGGSQSVWFPREYGPDPVCGDELPHIDPRLTLNPPSFYLPDVY